MPDVQELENPDIYVASQIISSDGVQLGKFEKEKTIPITYKDLPPHLVYALMAKEDERFREHSGIDLQAFLRAVDMVEKEVVVLPYLNNWQNYYLRKNPLQTL
jgi:penicillin-binding protein 1A